MSIAIKVEELSKAYQLGEIGTGTISRDLERWVAKLRGKEDPFLKIGEANDRSLKGTSDVVWSLRDINFEIEKGDAVGIIGRNGAGKSTLLKILSKVTSPTSGKISGKGRIASLLEVGTGFHPELTGRENIYLNGAILGMRKKEITRKLDQIIDFSGVERYVDTPVKRYSSGMYVRLAFAVAAHLESEILIVDEVLAVGDAEFQKKCLGKMNDVSKGEGRTVLFVSHQLGMIQSLCTSCIYLANGKLVTQGDTKPVIKAYMDNDVKVQASDMNDVVLPDNTLPAQINKISLKSEDGIAKNEFDVFEKKYLEIDLTIRENDLSFSLFYYLKKDDEIIICSHENDRNSGVFDKRMPGNYKYQISIPRFLKAGIYKFDCIGLGVPNKGPIHDISNIIEFKIGEFSFDPSHSGFSKNRPGILVSDSTYSIIQ